MTGWLRRNWIPTAGMAVAVAFVAWLGWINLRGGSGSGVVGATGTPSASASPIRSSGTASPTVDPAVAEVEAAAKAWIQAYYDAYKTGDVSVLEHLSLPDSQANGLAGVPRESVLHAHTTILATQWSFDVASPSVAGDSATVEVGYSVVVTPATWPSLKPTGPAETRTRTSHLELMRMSGQWLVTSFT